jgi:hypothetical protein
MRFRVLVSVKTVETWEIDARDEAEARELWEEGSLLRTDGYEMEKILSVKEAVKTTAGPV